MIKKTTSKGVDVIRLKGGQAEAFVVVALESVIVALDSVRGLVPTFMALMV